MRLMEVPSQEERLVHCFNIKSTSAVDVVGRYLTFAVALSDVLCQIINLALVSELIRTNGSKTGKKRV